MLQSRELFSFQNSAGDSAPENEHTVPKFPLADTETFTTKVAAVKRLTKDDPKVKRAYLVSLDISV